jgi:transposase
MRPDLKQFVLSTLCVDRAVPIWGKPEDGNASDKTLNATLLSEIAKLLARYGVAPGAYIYIADAAMVTEDNLKALGDTLFISRLPATYRECERVIDEAVAHNQWDEVGIMAQTKPTKHRPAVASKVSEGTVTLYGQSYRTAVVHSSSQDQRRQRHLARDIKAPYTALEAVVDAASKQEYFRLAGAEAAAAKLLAVQSAYHQVEVVAEERPIYGPGRPSTRKPCLVKALRYRLKAAVREQPESIARHAEEAGCSVKSMFQSCFQPRSLFEQRIYDFIVRARRTLFANKE